MTAQAIADPVDYSCVVCMTAQAIADPVDFYARRLTDAMKGIGTDDKQLIRVIVARSEVNDVMKGVGTDDTNSTRIGWHVLSG